MLRYLITSLRAVLFATFLACASLPVNADSTDTATRTTARTTHTTSAAPRAASDGVTADGVLVIVGIVGAVIVFAWVGSRFGDNR